MARWNDRNAWRSLVHSDSNGPVMLEDTGHRRHSRPSCWIMNLLDWRAHCSDGYRWIAPFGYVRNAAVRGTIENLMRRFSKQKLTTAAKLGLRLFVKPAK